MSVALVGSPQTGTFTSGTGVNYTVGAGSNRVAILTLCHSSSSGGGAPNYTGVQPTLAGVNMTQIGILVSNPTPRYMIETAWLIREADIVAGSQLCNATWSSGTNNINESGARYALFTFSGVDQTTPVTNYDTGNSDSATSISGAGLAVTAGGMVVLASGFNAGSNTGVGPAGYTPVDLQTSFDFSGYVMIAHKAISGAGTETPVVSWTGAAPASILTFNLQAVGSGNFTLAAGTGVYSYAGQAISLSIAGGVFTLVALPGAYSYVGADALADFQMDAGFGTYSYSGQIATLTGPGGVKKYGVSASGVSDSTQAAAGKFTVSGSGVTRDPGVEKSLP